jgi:hypothetical protein
VASYRQLTIFGLGGHRFVTRSVAAAEWTALTPISPLMKSLGFSNMPTDRYSRSELAPVKSRESMIRSVFVGSKSAS